MYIDANSEADEIQEEQQEDDGQEEDDEELQM